MLHLLRRPTLASAALVSLTISANAQNWPRFRGASGQGDGGAALVDGTFGTDEFNWRVELPGRGHSSPVVWDGRIFLTAHDPSTSACLLVCLNANDGDELWVRPLAVERYGMHDLNSYASVTPAVDAERVVLSWTSGETLHAAAFDHEGEPLWQEPLGQAAPKHGFGTSPALHEGVVLIGNDTEDAPSVLLGLDAATGKVLWKRERTTSRASFATPLVYAPEEGPAEAIFASSAHGITSLDPGTGELLWERSDLFRPRCVASPAIGGDILFATAGSGGGGKVGVALNLARRGEQGRPQKQYEVSRGLPYVPSPIATETRLYLWADGGVVSCLDIATGDELWRERVGGTFYGSPILADAKLLAISAEGELVVVSAGDSFEVLGRLDLGEGSNATPALASGVLYLRTATHLISVGPWTDE